MEKFQSREIRVPDSHPMQNAPAKQNVTWSNKSVSEGSPQRIKREERSYGAGESDPLYRVLQSQQDKEKVCYGAGESDPLYRVVQSQQDKERPMPKKRRVYLMSIFALNVDWTMKVSYYLHFQT
jgi:hypothetical protein